MTDQGIYNSKEFTNLEPAGEFKLSMVIGYKINTNILSTLIYFYISNVQLETKIFKNIIYKNPTS